MRKNSMVSRGISTVLVFILMFALAIPAFAGYDNAKLEIISCEKNAVLANYMTVKYRVTLSCTPSTIGDVYVKVNSKEIPASSFTKNSSNKYVYEGTTTVINTGKMRLYVIDVNAATGVYEQEIQMQTIVSSYPKLYVSLIGSNLGYYNSSILSICTSDDKGVSSIAVNNSVIASETATENKKSFNCTYNAAATGIYTVTVTDTDGNKTTGTVSLQNGTIVSQSSATLPIDTNLSTYIPFYNYYGYSSLSELYNDNPYLYYYYLNSLSSGTSGTTTSMYPYYSGGSFPTTGTSGTSSLYSILYQLMNGSSSSDNTMLLYYIMMLRNSDTSGESSDEYLTNYLYYQYIYGALSFTDGNTLTVAASGESFKLTAPKILNNSHASYQWQKYVDSSWTNISGATSSEYTLPTPLVNGDKFRVVISNNFYYSQVTSSIYIVGTTPVTPVTSTDPDDDEFTEDDIVIMGLAYQWFSVKKGQAFTLTPNYMGFWSFDSSYFSGSSTFGSITLTGLKTGLTTISFTAYDGNGNIATKNFIVQVVD